VYPRPIDLENTERLGRFPLVQVVASFEALHAALVQRLREVGVPAPEPALVSTPPR
jgi:hypothetical protein